MPTDMLCTLKREEGVPRENGGRRQGDPWTLCSFMVLGAACFS